MKTLIHGKSVELPGPPNPVSTIIQSAKAMARDNAALQAGIDRRDADLSELRAALAKERLKFHLPEMFFGIAICAFAVFIIWVFPHRG